MENWLPWIVIGGAALVGVALYLLQHLGHSPEAKRIGEVLEEDEGASIATTAAVIGSSDGGSSSSHS